MKKLVVLTMVVALFIGIPFCVFAQVLPIVEPRDASKWCKQIAADDPALFAGVFRNLGECVSGLQACNEYGNTPAVCYCRQVRILVPDAFQGLGQCIDYYREGGLP